MAGYDKRAGRIGVHVNSNGSLDHTYYHGAEITFIDGHNDSCKTVSLRLSVEEMRDLRYLLDRAISAADAK